VRESAGEQPQDGAQYLPHKRGRWIGGLAWLLAALYVVDRCLKLLGVMRFMQRPQPPAPAQWPSVTLLQPITRGASDLAGALACRAALRYEGHLEHYLIGDVGDTETLAACRSWIEAHPQIDARLIVAGVEPTAAAPVAAVAGEAKSPHPITTKVEKLQAALSHAGGDILAFVDDDILLRPDAIERLVCHLQEQRAGAVFGLACYTNWSNMPSSLLSAFVNGNALLSYLPLTYLCEPFTITGHFYALRREVFAAIGGLEGMDGRFDDDHELARRVQRHGLSNVQTPVVYDVDNRLESLNGYANQMRRWFVIPRQTMAPYLNGRQQLASLVGSVGGLVLPLLALLCAGGRAPLGALGATLALHAAVYTFCERAYLQRRTPLGRMPLVLVSALVAPVQALLGLLGPPTFTWRGRHIRLHRGGQFQEAPTSRKYPPPGGDA
jgi:ceramide glucosyltransferase